MFDLKEGDDCWARRSEENELYSIPIHPEKTKWTGSAAQLSLRDTGALFLTEEECEKDIEWQKAREILKRDTKGFKPNWKDGDQIKHVVFFDYKLQQLCNDYWCTYHQSLIYFASEEDAIESIKEHEKEWKIYLGVEE